MNEARRQAYLDALGIDNYVLRVPSDGIDVDQMIVSEVAMPSDKQTPINEPVIERVAESVSTLDWPQLQASVAACKTCGLHQTRTQTVFGVGSQIADLLIVGEAPGAEEDRQGKPFVGRAGQLLDNMLKAIGLNRKQVYIANILKCRPPGNRNPTIEEATACQGFLQRQIELIRPKWILAMGAVAAHNLLGVDEPVGTMRGRVYLHQSTNTQVRVTYHPAYLLRTPQAKAKSWVDLQALMNDLSVDP